MGAEGNWRAATEDEAFATELEYTRCWSPVDRLSAASSQKMTSSLWPAPQWMHWPPLNMFSDSCKNSARSGCALKS